MGFLNLRKQAVRRSTYGTGGSSGQSSSSEEPGAVSTHAYKVARRLMWLPISTYWIHQLARPTALNVISTFYSIYGRRHPRGHMPYRKSRGLGPSLLVLRIFRGLFRELW
jgi:hypothetical protein